MSDFNAKNTLINQLLNAMTPSAGREKPFVSVVTPTCNRAAFLPYLLYMFCYQDYPADRRELVILDDSPQSHLDTINALTRNQPESLNIRYIHHPEKLNLGEKRNRLNALARGEYIVCMDDDDFYPADKLSYTIEMMQRHRALISGSDQIPIWYSHINQVFKTCSFGERHILNGTLCYHRNYLKKHRYDDACNLSEEQAFTDNFRVTPLQLPGERTILCISHSHNTFDKDFVLSSSEATGQTVSDIVRDQMLLTWYHSLHNATTARSVQWQPIDKIVVINRDARADRWQQMQSELTLLHVPLEKILRFSACEHEIGALGRCLSHQQVLVRAQHEGWKNYLVLEDDVLLLKQEKHVNALNQLLAALPHFAWEVVLLGGQVKEGQRMKSLSGIIRANDSEKVCAYLVNQPYYATLLSQLSQDPSAQLEARWQPLQAQGKWLSFYPCISYQRPGFSDIQGKKVDYIHFYFNKVKKNQMAEIKKEKQFPLQNRLGKSIGFYMETAFHYQLYKPFIGYLLDAGYHCDLLISDIVPKPLLDEMCQLIATIDEPRLSGSRLTAAKNRKQQYACLVSPYYTPMLKALGVVQVRTMYGLAKESWNHAWWNAFYDHILCYGDYSRQALDINGSAKVVGNPRFDQWHTQEIDHRALDSLKLDPKKPTLLYAPTFGLLSSIPHWAAWLGRMSRDYNVIIKLHHALQHRGEEAQKLALAQQHLKKCVTRHDLTLPLLARADYVLSDNSGFIFDAIHAGKKVILLEWTGMDALLKGDKTYSHRQSPEQQMRTLLPTVKDMAQLRHCLSEQFDWQALEAPLTEIRRHFCDAFLDSLAGKRAAQVIIDALENSPPAAANTLLRSLQQKLF